MNKADNLPMSAEEWMEYKYPNFKPNKAYLLDLDEYANYLLSHHINVLAKRKYSEEEVEFLISLLRTTTEYEVLESFRNKVEQFKK